MQRNLPEEDDLELEAEAETELTAEPEPPKKRRRTRKNPNMEAFEALESQDISAPEELALPGDNREAVEALLKAGPQEIDFTRRRTRGKIPKLPERKDDPNWVYFWARRTTTDSSMRRVQDDANLSSKLSDPDAPSMYVRFSDLPPKFKNNLAQMNRSQGYLIFSDLIAMRTPARLYDQLKAQEQAEADFQMQGLTTRQLNSPDAQFDARSDGAFEYE